LLRGSDDERKVLEVEVHEFWLYIGQLEILMNRTTQLTRRLARGSIVAAVALSALLAGQAQADQARAVLPFQARIAETSVAVPCGPTLQQLCVTIAGSGRATLLGKISEAATVVVDLSSNPAPGCSAEVRTTTITAANGDQITMQATGQVCFGPTTGTASDAYVVTGGTGRYSGASGSGTDTASIDRVSGNAVSTFTGTLSSPGSLP